jgi:hypothetical protein
MADKTKVYEKELLKEKWLTALETNKYRQHFGSLFSTSFNNAACALGVYYKEAGISLLKIADYPSLTKDLGMTREEVSAIISLNDSFRLSFPEIARAIRNNTVVEECKKVFNERLLTFFLSKFI